MLQQNQAVISAGGDADRVAQAVLAAVVLAMLGLVLASSRGAIVFPLDDAYITLHNARTLLGEPDRSFGVSPLVGATSAAHLALIALLGLVFPLPLSSFVVGGLSVLLFALGLYRLFRCNAVSPSLSVFVVVVGLSIIDAPNQLTNGLETGMAMAAVVWCLVFYQEQSRIGLPLLCGVLPFIRPELGALSVGVFVGRAIESWRTPGTIVREALLAIVAAAPFCLWLWIDSGHLLPLTSNAKRAYFAEEGKGLFVKLKIAADGFWFSGLLPLFVALVFVPYSRVAIPALLYVALVFTAFVVTFPGGLWHNYFRYIYPLAPVPLLGLAIGLERMKRRSFMLIAVALFCIFGGIYAWPRISGGRSWTMGEMTDVAVWARANLPGSSLILVHDAGHFAWATPFRLVDVVGLKTPASIGPHRDITLPSLGVNRRDAINVIARASGVMHAVILNDAYWGQIASGLRETGWLLEPLREPAGRGYVVYRLTPPT